MVSVTVSLSSHYSIREKKVHWNTSSVLFFVLVFWPRQNNVIHYLRSIIGSIVTLNARVCIIMRLAVPLIVFTMFVTAEGA